ncbi:MAG: hypothetical protein ACPLRW_07365 [Moorellales bacterium]
MEPRRVVFFLPWAGAAVSVGTAGLLTAGTSGQKDAVLLNAVCCFTGALTAGVLGMKIFAGGDARMFGKRAVLPAEQQETFSGPDGGRAGIAQQAQPIVPLRVAQDAAAALAGIKSLIESLQVTDQQTWEKVAALAREAETALEEMRAGLDAAGSAAGRAMEAFRGIAALVEGR